MDLSQWIGWGFVALIFLASLWSLSMRPPY